MKAIMDKTLFFVPAKVLVILLAADVTCWAFPRYPNVAYALGLLLGVILQIAIPPRVAWKKQLVWMFAIVIVASLVHPLFRK